MPPSSGGWVQIAGRLASLMTALDRGCVKTPRGNDPQGASQSVFPQSMCGQEYPPWAMNRALASMRINPGLETISDARIRVFTQAEAEAVGQESAFFSA